MEAVSRGNYADAAGAPGSEVGGQNGDVRMGLTGGAAAGKSPMGPVDARLKEILAEASRSLPEGFTAKFQSGHRPGDRRFHGQGIAADIAIFDPKGRKLGNYQDENTFRTYEKVAQAARQYQMSKYPEMAKAFRWGGYFGGPKGKYGAMDTMHFDLGGNRVGMGGGSWEGGLNENQRRLFPGAVSQGMGKSQTASPRPIFQKPSLGGIGPGGIRDGYSRLDNIGANPTIGHDSVREHNALLRETIGLYGQIEKRQANHGGGRTGKVKAALRGGFFSQGMG